MAELELTVNDLVDLFNKDYSKLSPLDRCFKWNHLINEFQNNIKYNSPTVEYKLAYEKRIEALKNLFAKEQCRVKGGRSKRAKKSKRSRRVKKSKRTRRNH
jgi:hypothetical protein